MFKFFSLSTFLSRIVFFGSDTIVMSEYSTIPRRPERKVNRGKCEIVFHHNDNKN